MSKDSPGLIAQRRREIKAEIERLTAEDYELEVAEVVIRRLLGGEAPPAKEPRRRPKTQRQFVLDVLGHEDRTWISVRELVRLAQERWDAELSEKSLRPLLTQMKNQGEIARHGRLIAARSRAQEGSPPDPKRRRGG